MAESLLKKNGAEEKMQARIGGVWIAKLHDSGMAQCNLCAMDFSISSGGRRDVRRHQESARHAKLVRSKGSTKDGMVQ